MQQPHPHRAQAAQPEEHVLRSGAERRRVEGRAQLLPAALVRRDHAEQQVGMAAEVFRAGLDRDIDAARMRREEQRRRPGVVHHHDRVARMRDRRDRRNVLHLERQRARRLGEHHARVRLEQAGDVRAEQRVVVGRLDAEALQHRVAEIARRAIDRVRDQQVVAGSQEGQQRDAKSPRAPIRAARCRPRRKARSRRFRATRWSACPWCRRCSAPCAGESPARSDKAPSIRGRSAYSRSRAGPSDRGPRRRSGRGFERFARSAAAAAVAFRYPVHRVIPRWPRRMSGGFPGHLLRQRGPAVNPLTLLGDRSQMRHSGAAWEFVRS